MDKTKTMLIALACACGSSPAPVAKAQPPVIIQQPLDQTVLGGTTVTFTVAATGAGTPTYQWLKNGLPLEGETGDSFTTVAPAGLTHLSVDVTNAGGTVISDDAILNAVPASPRPPAFGDLRFQQVASPAKINGSDRDFFSNFNRGINFDFEEATGTPPTLGDGICAGQATGSDENCDWFFATATLAEGVTGQGILYQAASLAQLDTDTSGLDQGDTVISSLDVESAHGVYALSATHAKAASGFRRSTFLTDFANVAQIVAQEAAMSRVVTAISWSDGQVQLYSYGWAQDTATVYETSVVTSSVDGAGSAAQDLASQGYIVTAFGGNGEQGMILIGTRVQGDTMPRALLVASNGAAAQLDRDGYATVGVVFSQAHDDSIWIGER
jgi:beta-galactosidase